MVVSPGSFPICAFLTIYTWPISKGSYHQFAGSMLRLVISYLTDLSSFINIFNCADLDVNSIYADYYYLLLINNPKI